MSILKRLLAAAGFALALVAFQNAYQGTETSVSHYDPRCSASFTAADLGAVLEAINATGMSEHIALAHAMNRLGYGRHASIPDSQLLSVGGAADATSPGKRVAVVLINDLRAGSLIPTHLQTLIKNRFPRLAKKDDQIHAELAARYTARDQARAAGDQDLAVEIDREIQARKADFAPQLAGKMYLSAALRPGLASGEIWTDFWFNHFNVDSRKSEATVTAYENLMRANICGNFRDLLRLSAQHPAMLRYLDNYISVGRAVSWSGHTGLNENYARELMELHTLGVGPTAGVYTQADVTEVAKILTGWTLEHGPNKEWIRFKFNSAVHALGTKRVMGKVYPEGLTGGLMLLNDLAAHPVTKRNVCRKIGLRLMSTEPTTTLLNRCLSAWGTTGSLPRLYVSYLKSREFWSDYQRKVKNPIELVISANRLAGIHSSQAISTKVRSDLAAISRLGIEWRGTGAPTGYSERHLEWLSSGSLSASTAYFFQTLQSYHFVSVDGRVLTGTPLEDHLEALVAAGKREDALRLIQQRALNAGHLSFPTSEGGAFLRSGLAAPDRHPSSGRGLPLRTLLISIAGSRQFLLK